MNSAEAIRRAEDIEATVKTRLRATGGGLRSAHIVKEYNERTGAVRALILRLEIKLPVEEGVQD